MQIIHNFKNLFAQKLSQWLSYAPTRSTSWQSNYSQLYSSISPCDVLLIEGDTRVSHVIRLITQSNWTHAALYIGSFQQLNRPELASTITGDFSYDEPLVLEAELNKGTVIRPLRFYKHHHIRICRPQISRSEDVNTVIDFAISHLGTPYSLRQIFDLARFFLPYALLPRRWRSSLFEYGESLAAKTVCSTLIARSFAQIHYPILPYLRLDKNNTITMHRRNERLIKPGDFDYSPYFDIIKYPFLNDQEIKTYADLPWDDQGRVCLDPETGSLSAALSKNSSSSESSNKSN